MAEGLIKRKIFMNPEKFGKNKVKTKYMKKTKNTRSTNIHGSIEAQNIVKQVELIENRKKKKQDQKEKKKQEKDKDKEQF